MVQRWFPAPKTGTRWSCIGTAVPRLDERIRKGLNRHSTAKMYTAGFFSTGLISRPTDSSPEAGV